jgi:hypothetical protein
MQRMMSNFSKKGLPNSMRNFKFNWLMR